eukprot:883493-Pelagomonas_calceolata.AAC.1
MHTGVAPGKLHPKLKPSPGGEWAACAICCMRHTALVGSAGWASVTPRRPCLAALGHCFAATIADADGGAAVVVAVAADAAEVAASHAGENAGAAGVAQAGWSWRVVHSRWALACLLAGPGGTGIEKVAVREAGVRRGATKGS